MTEAPLTDDAALITERRHARRHRVLMGARIIFRDGLWSMAGHILNVSDTGAMLRPAHIAVCSEKFSLKPPADSPQKCEVVWRKGEILGVRYV